MRQRKPIINNDGTARRSVKRRVPRGHMQLIRHMDIPIIKDDDIVAVAGVGNKEMDYYRTGCSAFNVVDAGALAVDYRKDTRRSALAMVLVF